jgi:AcrR family transcriptional regulator
MLRADAEQNRARIVEVARETFAELGLDVSMAEIARRAGVGTATLYRRFPTKEALVTDVFADRMSACVATIDGAVADPDPWRGFCGFLVKLCSLQASDKGFTEAFIAAFPGAVDHGNERERVEREFGELTERAKAAGKLRADFAFGDLAMLLMANCGIIAANTEHAEAASRRFVAYMIQSFRAGNAEPLPPATPFVLPILPS